MLPIVPIQPKRVSEYAEAAGQEALDRVREAARQLQGLRVLNVSSTAYGGGVSELLQTQVPLMNDLGVDTTWVVIEGSDRFFNVVVVHDPQPAARLHVLEEGSRRKGKWIWRCHIDLSAPYRPVWDFFEPIVNRYDAAIFTAEEYVQSGVQGPVRAFIPPSIDPLSPKNAPMMESTWQGVLAPFGVDPDRPLVTQVSRFDPWKDPLGVIDAFRL